MIMQMTRYMQNVKEGGKWTWKPVAVGQVYFYTVTVTVTVIVTVTVTNSSDPNLVCYCAFSE